MKNFKKLISVISLFVCSNPVLFAYDTRGVNIERPLPNEEVKVLGFEFLHKKEEVATNEKDIREFLEKTLQKREAGKIVSFKDAVQPDVKDVVYFKRLDSNTTELAMLYDRILKLNSEKPIAFIQIVGHTDSDVILEGISSNIKNNQELSEYRAKTVAEFLQTMGLQIPLGFEGRADREPISSNETDEGKSKNRRTELFLYFERKKPNLANTLLTEINCEEIKSSGDAALDPMRITLDGKDVENHEIKQNVDFQRCQDVALAKAKMQIHFNPRMNEKRLALMTTGSVVKSGSTQNLEIYSSYLNLISRAELIYVPAGKEFDSMFERKIEFKKAEASFFPLPWNGDMTESDILSGLARSYRVKLRVYDKDGLFDETKAKNLSFSPIVSESEFLAQHEQWGESELQNSHIQVASSGSVLVNGEGLDPDVDVFVMGRKIPVSQNGRFVEEQLLESGSNYGITLVIRKKEKTLYSFQRDLFIPRDQFFLVGIVDATVGYNFKGERAKVITQDTQHYNDKIYLDARTAFFLKGKIKGKYILTAHADTREGPISEIFSNFLSKDPAALARRLDPEEFYPVYGDDSTLTEEAPTSGKFYVKIEKDKSYLMWGNYKVSYNDTVLARENRSYYGAALNLESGQVPTGDSSSRLNVYAANPGTLSARQDFRGGSSQFWLRNRDISIGSEQIMVETRDANSERVLKRRILKYGEDYDINYIQGHISLSDLLPSVADNSRLVQAGAFSGNPVYLVVTYEYVPGFESVENWNFGGRASQWIGDFARLGITGHRDSQGGMKNEVLGSDLKFNFGKIATLKLEAAGTRGTSAREHESLDGGYNFRDSSVPLTNDSKYKMGYFAELESKLYSSAEQEGHFMAGYKSKEGGYSAPGESTERDRTEISSLINIPFTSSFELLAKYDFLKEKEWVQSQYAQAQARLSVGKYVYSELGVAHDSQKDLSTGLSSTLVVNPEFGERLDGALKVGLQKKSVWNIYGLGQRTLERDDGRQRNNRYGGGAEYSFGKKFSLGGELTNGDQGVAAKASTNYAYDERTRLYNSYLLENNRSDSGLRSRDSREAGQLASGIKSDVGESSHVNYENKYVHGDRPSGLTHTFGLDFSPVENWTVNAGAELGTLIDKSKELENKRKAFSLGFDFANKLTSFGSQFEYRNDKNKSVSDTDNRTTYISRTKFNSKLSEEFRLLAKMSLSWSRSSKGDFYDGEYKDGILGLAYRPIENDRFNFLFKYRYFEVQPSAGQVDSSGNLPDFKQRDHILSADSIYDLSQHWSLGIKYAVNFSSLRQNRTNSDPWFTLQKHLGIFRLEYHVLKEWDLLGEGRSLWLFQQSQKQQKLGALLGLYRIMGDRDSFRLGVGYNFSSFTDDLTENDYKAQGIFINAIGVF